MQQLDEFHIQNHHFNISYKRQVINGDDHYFGSSYERTIEIKKDNILDHCPGTKADLYC